VLSDAEALWVNSTAQVGQWADKWKCRVCAHWRSREGDIGQYEASRSEGRTSAKYVCEQ
jgi:hypothetical protein